MLITITTYSINFGMENNFPDKDIFDTTGFNRVDVFKILFEAARAKKYKSLNKKINSEKNSSQKNPYNMNDFQLLLSNFTPLHNLNIHTWDDLTEEQKNKSLESRLLEDKYIDYFLSILIKINFQPKIVDLSLYNREYGPDFGQNILNKKLNPKK